MLGAILNASCSFCGASMAPFIESRDYNRGMSRNFSTTKVSISVAGRASSKSSPPTVARRSLRRAACRCESPALSGRASRPIRKRRPLWRVLEELGQAGKQLVQDEKRRRPHAVVEAGVIGLEVSQKNVA